MRLTSCVNFCRLVRRWRDKRPVRYTENNLKTVRQPTGSDTRFAADWHVCKASSCLPAWNCAWARAYQFCDRTRRAAAMMTPSNRRRTLFYEPLATFRSVQLRVLHPQSPPYSFLGPQRRYCKVQVSQSEVSVEASIQRVGCIYLLPAHASASTPPHDSMALENASTASA